jgi:hypothetical protein
MIPYTRQSGWLEPTILSGVSVSLLSVVLIHVYLNVLGVKLDQLLTFWAPLEVAGFIVLLAAFHTEDKWVFPLILVFAAALHLLLPMALVPDYVYGSDAIYGYQLVTQIMQKGNWVFGLGTGSTVTYSAFPMLFVFTALWSGIGTIPVPLIANYAIAVVNLTTFLTLRMLNKNLLGLSERQSNLILFFYSLTPTINAVDARFHYEAYAVIFFPLVLLYALKPRISTSETVVALVSVLAITLSHYFTSYILIANAVVLLIAFGILRGARISRGLLLLSILAPLAWDGTGFGFFFFEKQISQIQDVLQHVRTLDLSQLFGKVVAGTQAVVTNYPAPWFNQLATIRNLVIVVLSLIAIFSLCIAPGGRFRVRLARKDVFTYLAATWLFSLLFALAAYYGVAWNDTFLATEGTGSFSNRVVEFSFFQFAIFCGIGLSVLLGEIGTKLHARKLNIAKLTLVSLLVFIFLSSAVVQAYPRVAYDSTYTPVFYDEYRSTFQEPYYLGVWWSSAGNNTAPNSPFTGSLMLRDFIRGFGDEVWWENNMTSPDVDLNSSLSAPFSVHYAVDLTQLQKPDHTENVTLSPQLVSSQNSHLNTIFSTGRLEILVKSA